VTAFEAAVVQQLTRIADALVVIAAPMLLDDTQPRSGCDHPGDQRFDFGHTNGVDDWQCKVCGYRSVPPAEAA